MKLNRKTTKMLFKICDLAKHNKKIKVRKKNINRAAYMARRFANVGRRKLYKIHKYNMPFEIILNDYSRAENSEG